MLVSLNIQNVVLIERLAIEFRAGLCALTGETGAGKSILLDSLGLALGARSESSLVRNGQQQAAVSAEFHVKHSHPAFLILRDAGLDGDDRREIILRRTISADGRSRAFINDQPVSVGLLRQLGAALVEIHGQFDTHSLLNSAVHGKLLDDYAGLDSVLPELWQSWKDVQADLDRLKEAADKSRAEEEYLRLALEDLDALDPQAGEENYLGALRDRLMNREQIMEALNVAYQALTGDNDPVRSAWATLDRVADKLGEDAEGVILALERAAAEIEEATALIASLSDDLQESDHNLETIDERLFSLKAQTRKHECTIEELPGMRATLAMQLDAIEHADEVLAGQMKLVEKARKSYMDKAAIISKKRRSTAKKLDSLVQKELPPLKMEKARFVTDISELAESDWGPHGCERVQFLVATNPGSDPGPLSKIASGGEMARFMLALKVVMAASDNEQSLIFDEVDTGIGGSTADAVGERLARLAAAGRQVLVVTHSPQVASKADNHWVVRKDGSSKITTNVVYLRDAKQRREEIARMLSGALITKEARAAADKLLES